MLERILSKVRILPDPDVLVGFENADDAGVYRLDDKTALVQTIDFFTPVVDDPGDYGGIAAANALSDIYAMGGRPLTALSVVGFPAGAVDEEVLQAIVLGGIEKMNEAGVPVIGGHSVQDPEIKFGFCVTGVVAPDKIVTNGGAQPGDALLLTKPLGTGIITTGVKYGKTPAELIQTATRWMLKLNENPSRLFQDYSVHAVTDITGYGLIGHAYEMARASCATLEIKMDCVPVMDGTLALAKQGMLPGGIESNRAYVGNRVTWENINPLEEQILLDPQTSGGLLISLPASQVHPFITSLELMGGFSREIGVVTDSKNILIRVF